MLYPSGTMLRVIKSDQHTKTSARKNSIGYKAETLFSPNTRFIINGTEIIIEAANIVFIRFGNQIRERHEKKPVLLIRPSGKSLLYVPDMTTSSVERIVDDKLSTYHKEKLKTYLKELHSLPRLVVEKHVDYNRTPQLINSLMLDDVFREMIYDISRTVFSTLGTIDLSTFNKILSGFGQKQLFEDKDDKLSAAFEDLNIRFKNISILNSITLLFKSLTAEVKSVARIENALEEFFYVSDNTRLLEASLNTITKDKEFIQYVLKKFIDLKTAEKLFASHLAN